LHAKTGRLDNVRALAGYLRHPSGRRLALVILHNHYLAHRPVGERIQDALLDWLYHQPLPARPAG
jgi:D-alanyl-D-alanine carboxypeptidase/D-alanyl-D-alanine-endopeptidase (penicillin-binding protein 4)